MLGSHFRQRSLLRSVASLLASLGVVAVSPIAGRAQSRATDAIGAPGYAITSWTTEDGLPSNVVLDVRQTSDGYLWLASYQGLVRFDGVAFRTFSEADIPGLGRGSFWALAADSAGTLWAASEASGLARRRGAEWTVFTTRQGLKSDKLTALARGRDGTIWIGSRAGVTALRGDRVERLPVPPGGEPTVSGLAESPDGTLWIGTTTRGLLRYRDGRYAPLTLRDGLGDDRVSALYAEPDGTIWAGGYGTGVTRIRGGATTRLAASGANAPTHVTDILRDAAGTLWIAADNGLFRLDHDSVVALPATQPITQAEVLRSDAEGNLWIGSRQLGLFRVRGARVGSLGQAEGLPHRLVFAVDGDGAGGAWLATQGGAAHLTARGVRVYTRAGGALPDDIARDVLQARSGDAWIATNGGVTRVRGDRVTTYTSRDGLADDRARVVLEDHAGTIWVGTFNGLSELRGDRFRSYGRADGLVDGYVLSLFEDSRHTIWVGTQSEGLFRLSGGRLVPGPSALGRQPIFHLAEDRDGTLWVGTARGLARVRGGDVALFGTREGLPGNAIFQAIDDSLGALWLTGPWGIARVTKSSLDSVAAGTRRGAAVKQFGRDDGLVAREASSVSKGWRAPDGALWLPTPVGVAIVRPGQLPHNALAPPVHVEQVIADGDTLDARAPVVIRPGTRRIEFRYTATSYVAPTQIRFRYKLEGFDRDWVDAGTRRVAFFTNLAPGRYVFRVEARNEDGARSVAPATATVRLRPYFWQTWWSLTIALAAIVVGALVGHQVRIRVVRRRLRLEMLHAMSLRDELTGLYNRRGFVALAEQQMRIAERTGRGFDVVFADMDGMKAINDSCGHAGGDRALVDAAATLVATFRKSDILARLGGDEFAALVIDDGSDGSVESARARLQSAVDALNARGDRPYQLSMSVGVTRFDPLSPAQFDTLLERADRDMYAQKRLKGAARLPTPPIAGPAAAGRRSGPVAKH